MNPRIILLIASITAIIRPIGLQAQTYDTTQFQKFVQSDFFKELAGRAVASLPSSVFQRCPTLVSPGSKATVIKPVLFAASGRPNGGVWHVAFPVSGCGNDTILNFYFVAGSDEKVQTLATFPGTTHAGPTLQKDAYVYATLGPRSLAKDCKEFYVKHTKFEGYGLANPSAPDPGANARFRPFWETWTVIGCGRTFTVPISFQPDETGTKIFQSVSSVVELKQ